MTKKRPPLTRGIISDIINPVTKADKLLEKLKRGSISVAELQTLLQRMGWHKARQKGSHQTWTNGQKVLVLASHDKELKRYSIKQAQDALEVD